MNINYTIRWNPESWSFTLNDIDDINQKLEEYTERVHSDTVYLRLKKNGELHIDGTFKIEDLIDIVGLIKKRK